jgi:hypothetical protein
MKKEPRMESRRRRPKGGQRVAAYLPSGTVKRLRLQCVKEDCSVSDAITRAVEDWLGERIGKTT